MTRLPLFCILALTLFRADACLAITGPETVSHKEPPSMAKKVFGKLPDGRPVHQYTLDNKAGAVIEVIDYGATIRTLSVPDRNGKSADVVLGYDSLQGYMGGTAYFGAVVGRYGNRIGAGKFTLDGKSYQLTVNDGINHLHGGRIGFNKVLWEVKEFRASGEPSILLEYVSRDGEEGYPGTVTIRVRYTLTGKNELQIEYEGTTDKPTVLNPTQHSYFNLSGAFTGTILDHQLMLEADGFTPVDAGLIPTGQIAGVDGTPFDFRKPMTIGARINDAAEQMRRGNGYDHNWVLRGAPGALRKAAEVYEPSTGRMMTVLTDQPGLQFYSGNFLDGSAKGKGGVAYQRRSGLCLETQAFPDTPNKPQFPSITLKPGETYRQTTIYQFSTR